MLFEFYEFKSTLSSLSNPTRCKLSADLKLYGAKEDENLLSQPLLKRWSEATPVIWECAKP
jgi:hypothetical protein